MSTSIRVAAVVGSAAASLALALLAHRRVKSGSGADDEALRELLREARRAWAAEPVMRAQLKPILGARSFEEAVAAAVAARVANGDVPLRRLRRTFSEALLDESAVEGGVQIGAACRADAAAVVERDPAAESLLDVLNFKGFAALVAHRVARRSWRRGDKAFAKWLQGRASDALAVDLHPACTIGRAVVFDHGTGVVVGETATIGEGCTILHGVTLGATGKDRGDRHPKVGKDVLLGAGVSILGNIHIGDGAKIGCGAVVLRSIPSGATAVGAPAKIVGASVEKKPATQGDLGLYSVRGAHGKAWTGCCPWRDIASEPASEDTVGFAAFRENLDKENVPADEIGEMYFDLYKDGSCDVAKFKLRFPSVAERLCSIASMHCKTKCSKVCDAVCDAPKRTATATPMP